MSDQPISRRGAIMMAAAVPIAAALPALAGAADLQPWPHPTVGVPAIPAIPAELPEDDQAMWAAPDLAFAAICGVWVQGGRVLDRGRKYTREEWERVGPDVLEFIERQWPIRSRLARQGIGLTGGA